MNVLPNIKAVMVTVNLMTYKRDKVKIIIKAV